MDLIAHRAHRTLNYCSVRIRRISRSEGCGNVRVSIELLLRPVSSILSFTGDASPSVGLLALFFHLLLKFYGPQRARLPISPTVTLVTIFPSLPGPRLNVILSRYNCSTLTTRQPMVKFYLLMFSRFPLWKKRIKIMLCQESNSRFPHELLGIRGYLLFIDHSGDECNEIYQSRGAFREPSTWEDGVCR